MGGQITRLEDVVSNAAVSRFIGEQPVSDIDPFWNTLFSFNLKLTKHEDELSNEQQEEIDGLLYKLVTNTRVSHNLASFVAVFRRRMSELRPSEQCNNTIFLWQTKNSLVLLRLICRYLAMHVKEAEIVRLMDDKSSSNDKADASTESQQAFTNSTEALMHSLAEIISELPINDRTELIHGEAIRCLIALFSCQLYSENVDQSSIISSFFLTGSCSKLASTLTRQLLTNYLLHTKPLYDDANAGPQSIVLGIASSFWSVVRTATGLDEDENAKEQSSVTSLASLSLLLLLILACNPTKERNPYKQALALFQNAQEVSTIGTSVTFKLDYNQLYERLCSTAVQEPSMLLLYLLLHENSGFLNYVLSRINLETLVLPVLRILHDGISSATTNSHHVYLALIVVLILSEDDFFCKVIHETTVKDIEWVDDEFSIKEVTIGGLVTLVLVRTIQKNAIKHKDRYLHTNCLAALANMSAFFKNLSPIVCQKMIGLLELLTKRHAKLISQMREMAENPDESNKPTGSPQSCLNDDINALEEGIRTLLEIVNCCLSNSLRHNANLIYTLLYHKDLFESYKNHPFFQDLVSNISLIIVHFNSKVSNIAAGNGKRILEAIDKEVLVWPTDKLAKFPELKFRYVEDDNTVEFFSPYVWRLVTEFAGIYFVKSAIKIFNAFDVS
ncbi:hypothetical protein WR25_12726 [Diploscapter pachys]|uniref:Dymeclin n=1 Tax=Diploscapter pachys TaxID=2018661 RepID=A0A2A2LLB8_9BILA|nr:hypothetical protein WR25_12726 [Diploscapter pachys]